MFKYDDTEGRIPALLGVPLRNMVYGVLRYSSRSPHRLVTAHNYFDCLFSLRSVIIIQDGNSTGRAGGRRLANTKIGGGSQRIAVLKNPPPSGFLA